MFTGFREVADVPTHCGSTVSYQHTRCDNISRRPPTNITYQRSLEPQLQATEDRRSRLSLVVVTCMRSPDKPKTSATGRDNHSGRLLPNIILQPSLESLLQ